MARFVVPSSCHPEPVPKAPQTDTVYPLQVQERLACQRAVEALRRVVSSGSRRSRGFKSSKGLTVIQCSRATSRRLPPASVMLIEKVREDWQDAGADDVPIQGCGGGEGEEDGGAMVMVVLVVVLVIVTRMRMRTMTMTMIKMVIRMMKMMLMMTMMTSGSGSGGFNMGHRRLMVPLESA